MAELHQAKHLLGATVLREEGKALLKMEGLIGKAANHI